MVVNDRTRLIADSGFLTLSQGVESIFSLKLGKSVRPLFFFYIKQLVIIILATRTRISARPAQNREFPGAKDGLSQSRDSIFRFSLGSGRK